VTTYSDGQLCYSKDNHDGWGADALTTVEIRDGLFRRVAGPEACVFGDTTRAFVQPLGGCAGFESHADE
jgi:hypothetical protein